MQFLLKFRVVYNVFWNTFDLPSHPLKNLNKTCYICTMERTDCSFVFCIFLFIIWSILTVTPTILHFSFSKGFVNNLEILIKVSRQAGAELCQAQVKLRLAKLAVNRNKLRAYLLQVWGHIPFKKNLIWSFIFKHWGCFPFAKIVGSS